MIQVGEPLVGDYISADHTKLSAVNTCPVFGIIRYEKHKTISGADRALPLEAGQAAHEAFAAIRLFQLEYIQKRPDLAQFHGIRIFNEDRWNSIKAVYKDDRTQLSNLMNFGIQAFDTSGYYDDERDRRRTKDNIIECIMQYAQQWDTECDIWIRDPASSTSDVGIEIAFNYGVLLNDGNRAVAFNFTGKIDGIFLSKRDKIITVDENKTGARIDEAWLAQWRMSHQITGYAIAAAKFSGSHLPILPRARIIGMQIPMPRDAMNGIRAESVPRGEHMLLDWERWMFHTLKIMEENNDDPVNAPRYTHSCNRYFRPCSFLALCDAPPEVRQEIYENMAHDEWSPLKEQT